MYFRRAQYHAWRWLWPMIWMATACTDQAGDVQPEDVFVKYYGVGQYDVADVVATPNNEYLILATKGNNLNRTVVMLRIGSDGNQLGSEVQLGQRDTLANVAVKLKPLSDNRYAVLFNALVTSTTGIRDIATWTVIGPDLDVTGLQYREVPEVLAADILPTTETDGVEKVLLFGSTNLDLPGDVVPRASRGVQMVLGKYNVSDNVLHWQKPFGFAGDDLAIGVTEQPSGNLLIVGRSSASKSSLTGTNIYVLNTNSLGTADKSGNLLGVGPNESANDNAYAVVTLPIGFAIVGSTQNMQAQEVPFMLWVDDNGAKIPGGEYVYDDNDYLAAGRALDITRMANGELMLVGSFLNFNPDPDDELGQGQRADEIMLMRLTQSGNRIAGADRYYGTRTGADAARAVTTTADGDVLVAANVDFGSSNVLIGLLKLNSKGELRD